MFTWGLFATASRGAEQQTADDIPHPYPVNEQNRQTMEAGLAQ